MSRIKRPARVALAALAVAFSLGVAVTATNVVPASRADAPSGGAPTANELKPTACAPLDLVSVVVGSGTFNGTNSADLMLGSAGVDSMRGRARDDCILGGGGNDSLRGNGGTDVCIGGPGFDTFAANCETQIQ